MNTDQMFTWQIKDFAEFNKLIDLTLDGVYSDHIATVSNDGSVNLFNISTQCTNCDEIFEKNEFERHCCQYDKNKKFIFDDQWEQRLFYENIALQITNDNLKEIKKILQQCNENATKSIHTCFVCQRAYVHATGLLRHMEIHHTVDLGGHDSIDVKPSVDMYQCLICGQIFTHSTGCFKHLKELHSDYGFKEDDDDATNDETSLFEKITIDRILKCEFCDGLFTEIPALHQHELNHDINIGYECSNCEVASRNLKFVLNHRNNDCPYQLHENAAQIDTNFYFVCSACDAMFTSMTQLYEHRYTAKHFQALFNRHTNRHEYFCEKCCQIFIELNELLEHADNFHSKKSKSHNLISDVVTRPFLCEVCGKGYTQSSHLYQHLRFHKGIKPFECSFESCARRFTIRPDLNDHIRKCHTGERPYKCADCTKTFLTGSVYYQHRLIHRNERRYGCRTCEKRFHRSDALKNHERIHTGEKPYACDACSKKFRQKGDRDKHFRSRHHNSIKKLDTVKLPQLR